MSDEARSIRAVAVIVNSAFVLMAEKPAIDRVRTYVFVNPSYVIPQLSCVIVLRLVSRERLVMGQNNASPRGILKFVYQPSELVIEPGILGTGKTMVNISSIQSQELPILVVKTEVACWLRECR